MQPMKDYQINDGLHYLDEAFRLSIRRRLVGSSTMCAGISSCIKETLSCYGPCSIRNQLTFILEIGNLPSLTIQSV